MKNLEDIIKYFENRRWKFMNNIEKYAIEGNFGKILEEMIEEIKKELKKFGIEVKDEVFTYIKYMQENVSSSSYLISLREYERSFYQRGFQITLLKFLYSLFEEKIGKKILNVLRNKKSINIEPLLTNIGWAEVPVAILPKFLEQFENIKANCFIEDYIEQIYVPWRSNIHIKLKNDEKGERSLFIELFKESGNVKIHIEWKNMLSLRILRDSVEIANIRDIYLRYIREDVKTALFARSADKDSFSIKISRSLDEVLLKSKNGSLSLRGFSYTDVDIINKDLYIRYPINMEINWNGRIFLPKPLPKNINVKAKNGKVVFVPKISEVVELKKIGKDYFNYYFLETLNKIRIMDWENFYLCEEKKDKVCILERTDKFLADIIENIILHVIKGSRREFLDFSFNDIIEYIENSIFIHTIPVEDKDIANKAKSLAYEYYKTALLVNTSEELLEYKGKIWKYLKRFGINAEISDKIECLQDPYCQFGIDLGGKLYCWSDGLFLGLVLLGKILEDASRAYKIKEYHKRKFGINMEEEII